MWMSVEMRLEFFLGPPGRPAAHQGPPPTHQHPMGGGWRATASSGVSGARVVAAQWPWWGLGGALHKGGGAWPGGRRRRAPRA